MKILLSLLCALCLWLPAAAQAPPPQPTLSPAQPKPAPLPQAKSQAEFDAYKEAMQEPATLGMQEAVKKFVAAYPESELRSLLYQQLMERYYHDGNGEQTVATARALLQLEPDNPAALARSATVLAETTNTADAAGQQRLEEAQKNAQRLLSTIDRTIGTLFQPDTPPDQMAATRRGLTVLAYSALGKAGLDLKQYPAAEEALRNALKLAPGSAQNLYRLALTLDHEGRYPEALEAVTQALQNAQNTPGIVENAQRERERLQQLAPASSAAPPH
jgi:tetratricopeptide (TPR) repeat protein